MDRYRLFCATSVAGGEGSSRSRLVQEEVLCSLRSDRRMYTQKYWSTAMPRKGDASFVLLLTERRGYQSDRVRYPLQLSLARTPEIADDTKLSRPRRNLTERCDAGETVRPSFP